jgi:calreticulin
MIHITLLLGLLALAQAHVYFSEDFTDADWESRWVVSTSRSPSERGKFGLSAGKFFGDEEAERGLQSQEDARFYYASAAIPEEFSNKGKTLVVQFSLKQDQNIDCGGGYVKLHPAGVDQKSYNNDSPYNIMFGPDICGGTRRTHVILNRRGENHLIKNDIPTETDTYTHVYTLILNPDNTFQVLTDNKESRSGSIEDNWDILEPKQINDPSQSKPADWVDEAQIDDPEDIKPEGYDAIPAEINDPEAAKPEDWDDELDGEWAAPVVPNPEYKGPWKAKRIANPAYKGPWVHPQIDNPAYESDDSLYAFDSFKYVGIEVWQVKSGSIWDNFLVTDDVKAASAAAAAILKRQDSEKEAEKKQADEKAPEAEEDNADDKEEL